MAATFKQIATTLVGSGGSATITFSGIPQTYNDLVLLFSGRTTYNTDTNDQIRIYFNNNTSNYSHKILTGTGTGTDGDGTQTTAPGINAQTETGAMTANTFSNDYIYIPNYTSATRNKSVLHDHTTENAFSLSYYGLGSTTWINTSAVTSISIQTFRGTNWVENTRATLFGINNS